MPRRLYGYDETSVKRVKRDPNDPAKLLLVEVPGRQGGYLPALAPGDPFQPQWAGQESTGVSRQLDHRDELLSQPVCARAQLIRRRVPQAGGFKPNADSGLRNPSDPKRVIRNKDVSAEELFEAARLVVAAEIAKIHTIEWTPQLLYDEPLYKGMNANWNGLLGTGDPDTFEGAGQHRGPRLRQVEGCDQGVAVVFGVCFRAGNLRAGQQGPALRHRESRRREWRRQSLRIAVQFPGRIRHGVPAASAGAGSDRSTATLTKIPTRLCRRSR